MYVRVSLLLCLALASCTAKNKSAATGDTNAVDGSSHSQSNQLNGGTVGTGDLLGGGDLFNAYLGDVRTVILGGAVQKLIQTGDFSSLCRFDRCPNDNNSLCRALPTLTADQISFCRNFLQQNISKLGAGLASASIRVVGVTHDILLNGVPVTAGTTLSETGDIEFNIGRVRDLGLKRLDVAAQMGHEFLHKVAYPGPGSFVADLQAVGPYTMSNGGFELLTTAGLALAFYAQSLGLDAGVSELTNPSLGISNGQTGDFGTTSVGSTTVRTFTVTNYGGSEASSFTVDTGVTAPFAITAGSCLSASTLAAGASCTVTLAFHPTAAGQSSSELRIYYDRVDAVAHVAWSKLALTGAAIDGTVRLLTPSYPTLAKSNAGCTAGAAGTLACRNAAALYCRSAGFAAGFGPMVVTADQSQVVVTCLTSDGAGTAATTFTALQAFQPGCKAGAETTVDCNAAVDKWCGGQQLGMGAGVFDSDATGGAVSVTCLKGGAKAMHPTWNDLAPPGSACTQGSAGDPAACLAAVDQYCAGQGLASGFGPSSADTAGPVVICAGTASAPFLAVNAGGGAADPFGADAYFAGGSKYAVGAAIDTSQITNPAPQAVYQSQRYLNFTYTITGLTAGALYTIRLHFAELYYTSAGQRPFTLSLNGVQVLNNFDVFTIAGGKDIALAQAFTLSATSSGSVTIDVKSPGIVNGIEVSKR